MLAWLFARQRFGIKPGLTRVRTLLQEVGNPQARFKVVLVGGTNGKGSCAASLAAMLGAAGYRVGRFTSPHLTHFQERFAVNNVPAADADIARQLARLKPLAEAVGATFFEIATVLGCLLFAEADVDYAVMEVGMGGRWDATNALEPQLSIITNVALDHTEVLGADVLAIAAEKAGIMRSGVATYTAAQGEALGVLRQQAELQGATLYALGKDWRVRYTPLGWDGGDIGLRAGSAQTLRLRTPLLGAHQAENVALAALAALALGVNVQDVMAGAAETRWPGRLEPLTFRGRRFLLDGAHNPAAARALRDALVELSAAPATFIFGVSADKDIAQIVLPLAAVAREVVVTAAAHSPRAALPAALAACWQAQPLKVTVAAAPAEALTKALALTPPEVPLVVCGSLFLVGEVRALILGEDAESKLRLQ